ncbi:hypothetical protein BC835DRAFT_1364659 [Cytidiella melzeri]|nr:hypothetical protein BC835DRAFT_1364659 [Cytidiella melzeri]
MTIIDLFKPPPTALKCRRTKVIGSLPVRTRFQSFHDTRTIKNMTCMGVDSTIQPSGFGSNSGLPKENQKTKTKKHGQSHCSQDVPNSLQPASLVQTSPEDSAERFCSRRLGMENLVERLTLPGIFIKTKCWVPAAVRMYVWAAEWKRIQEDPV